MVGQAVGLTRWPGQCLNMCVQRLRNVSKERPDCVHTNLGPGCLQFVELPDELLQLLGIHLPGVRVRLALDRFAFQETTDVLRSTGLGTSAGQAFTTEWLGAHDGTDLVAVHIGVTHLDPAGNTLDTAINTAVDAKRQAVAFGVDVVHHLVDVLRLERGHVEDWPENFFFKLLNTTDAENCRRNEQAFLGDFHFLQQLAVALELLAVIHDLLAGVLVDHRAHVRGKQPGIADAKLFHGTVEHFQKAIGNVFLHVEHAQGGATLTGTLERRGQHVAHYLLWQCGGIHDHRVQAAGLCHQRRVRCHILGHHLVDALGGSRRTGEAHAAHPRIGGQGRTHGGAGARHQLDGILRDTRLMHQLHSANGQQGCLLSRLGHHGVTRGQVGQNLPGEDRQREVPGRDTTHYAAGIAAVFVADGLVGVVLGEIDRFPDLSDGIQQRFASFTGSEREQLGVVLLV